MWDRLDYIHMNRSSKKAMSVEEVLKWVENSVREVDVIVKLAFCGKVSSLGCQTTNKQMAEARLQSVKRKLQRDEKFHIQYRQFKLWRTSLTAVTPERWLTKSKNVAFATPWCIHPQTNNKIRVVFDAAAMQDVVSLNHELIALRSSPNQQPAGSSTEV